MSGLFWITTATAVPMALTLGMLIVLLFVTASLWIALALVAAAGFMVSWFLLVMDDDAKDWLR